MNKISVGKLFELYFNTLEMCGESTKNLADETIEYTIFEEFIIGITSFLSSSCLERLLNTGLIDEQIFYDSKLLRFYTLELDGGTEWNVPAFKNSKSWNRIMKLSDKIKNQIQQKWTIDEMQDIYKFKN